MSAPASTTVADLSEGELLDRILTALSGTSRALVGPGDDAAVLAVPGGRVVVTTDTLVHGPDFRLAWSTGFDLGVKSAAVNLADVAAMGARPTALFVALALPPSTAVDFVDELAGGLRDACERLAPGCAVEGGDLTVSDVLTVAVTAVGVLDGRGPVLRGGAHPGDVIAIAGELGPASRGLSLLFDRFRDGNGSPIAVAVDTLSESERRDLGAQLRPAPPVSLGVVAADAGATAMMDVSDGLLLDATRMAAASGVTLAFSGITDDAEIRGGEDHALLACFPHVDAVPAGFRTVGRVIERAAAPVTFDGTVPTGAGGWDPVRDWDSSRG